MVNNVLRVWIMQYAESYYVYGKIHTNDVQQSLTNTFI